MDKWLEAFHIFVAIYTGTFPQAAPSLMKLATIVQRFSKQAGDEAALFYDQQFRMWREDNPDPLPWGQLSIELQSEALVMGLSKKQTSTLSKKSKPNNADKFCFRFNNSGQRPRTNYPISHTSQKCGGSHGKKQCTKQSSNTGPNDPYPNKGLKRTGSATSIVTS